ncbi:MAG: ABC transporter substrate-binding protein, partial [Chloroflexi bacterium]|nr:ABC transporter substrate-binding protein [Chloroflexota bacterium]
MYRKKWLDILWSIFILIALLAGPLLSGCKASVSGETPTYTYTAGVLGTPTTKNPFAALAVTNLYNADGLPQVYEPLLMWTNNYTTAIPLLAKSWEYKAATKAWTFHLDEKAKFSDGTQVTASDVKYSWDTALKITGDSTNVLITMVKSIAVVDTKTVTIELKDAF